LIDLFKIQYIVKQDLLYLSTQSSQLFLLRFSLNFLLFT